MYHRLAIALLALSFPLAVGCVGQHRQLRFTPALQAVQPDFGPHLVPDATIDSVLGVADLLLGPRAGELPLEPFEVDEGRLDELFPEEEADADVVLAYRFVHFTDVQIRDRGNGVGARLERLVDRHVIWTQNNFYQDHADLLYFAFMARAMRQMLDQGSHAFVVHTGDSMHIANHSELEAFNHVLERQLMHEPAGGEPCASCWTEHGWLTPAFGIAGDPSPRHLFFNVVGNHDVLRWGNWTRGDSRLVRANDKDIAGLDELSGALASLGGGTGALVDPALVQGAAPTPPGGGPASFYTTDIPLPSPAPDVPAPVVRIVALNVYEASPRGRFGSRADEAAVSDVQRDWLRATLDEASADEDVDHVLVFGHERLWKVAVRDADGAVGSRGALGDLLGRYPKVVAYLSGHAHSGASPVSPHTISQRYPFAHYTLPSMMEYPKVLTSIAVRRLADGTYRIQAMPLNLVDLGVAGDPFTEPETSVDLGQRVHTRQQEAFEEWLAALDQRCGGDVTCRARQLATDCLAGAVVDRPDRVDRWRATGSGFETEIAVPRKAPSRTR